SDGLAHAVRSFRRDVLVVVRRLRVVLPFVVASSEAVARAAAAVPRRTRLVFVFVFAALAFLGFAGPALSTATRSAAIRSSSQAMSLRVESCPCVMIDIV